MEITSLSRSYSRSIEIQKPDGKMMWIKQEMTATASLAPEDAENLKVIGDNLEEIVRKEVGASLKAEKAKIDASFAPKSDEPFPGKMPGSSTKTMPKLKK